MKKLLIVFALLVTGQTASSQDNEDMGGEFSINGRSISIFRSEMSSPEVLKANAKATYWTLKGIDGLVASVKTND